MFRWVNGLIFKQKERFSYQCDGMMKRSPAKIINYRNALGGITLVQRALIRQHLFDICQENAF